MTDPIALPGFDGVNFDPRPAPFLRWLEADVFDGLASLATRSVSAAIFSPPYYARRRYSSDPREVGLGDLADYLDQMVAVFNQLARVLRRNGVVWTNIGDTSSGSGGSGGDHAEGGSKEAHLKYRQGKTGVAPGQWLDVPHRLVHRLQDAGWWLRSEVVWDKGQRRPESLDHVRRPGESHESIFMLTPNAPAGNPYRFFADRLVEQGSVWHVRPGGGGGSDGHVAVYPEELVERCLLPCTEPGDVVLDPFAGSGTTLAVAAKHGRSAIGIDFDPANTVRATQRLALIDKAPTLSVDKIAAAA